MDVRIILREKKREIGKEDEYLLTGLANLDHLAKHACCLFSIQNSERSNATKGNGLKKHCN